MIQTAKARRLFAVLTLASVAMFTGCGGDDDKEEGEGTGEPGALGAGYVARAEGGKVELSFDGSEKDQQFVVMPYILGDGAGAGEEKVGWTIATAAGESAGLVPYNTPKTMKLMEARAARSEGDLRFAKAKSDDHKMRTLLNRFDPRLGLDQGRWFWDAASDLGSMQLFERMAARPVVEKSNVKSLAATTMAACPADEVPILDPEQPDAEPLTESIPDGGSVEKDSFCLVFLSDPATEADKAKIEASVTTIMSQYKAIYGTDFADANGYSFKPVVVVMDFSDDNIWPNSDDHPGLQISGAFIGRVSSEVKYPVLYMASDLTKVTKFEGVTDAALLARLWHGTLAHEMQHAVIDYFRKHKTVGTAETPSVDEGLAHYMEDLFGYGADNFESFVGAFLGNFNEAEASPPILSANDDDDILRGAAQALWYYLVSQKGGVTFEGGKAKAGGGLDFVSQVVQDASGQGKTVLSAKFGGEWVDTMGNFYGSLVLDGSTVEGVADQYEAQDPVAEVTDLQGGTGKTYGMKFNGYGGAADRLATNAYKPSSAVTKLEDMDFYQTAPLLYTVADPATKLTFTPSGTFGNTAVSVVRVK